VREKLGVTHLVNTLFILRGQFHYYLSSAVMEFGPAPQGRKIPRRVYWVGFAEPR
jgi:hypothetical protein